jgi:hypothetical protein
VRRELDEKLKKTVIVASTVILCAYVMILATVIASINKTTPSFSWLQNSRPINDTHIHRNLSREEESKALDIITNDSQICMILKKGYWEILNSGPWFEGKEKAGVLLYIRFNESVWVEGTFINPFNNKSYHARMWVGGMHVLVDLKTNKVLGVDLGMGRPPQGAPKINESEKLALAERIARKRALAESLGSNVTSYLASVYYTNDYPYGIAFFCLCSSQGEAIVAVDLGKMEVVEKYTAIVRGVKE